MRLRTVATAFVLSCLALAPAFSPGVAAAKTPARPTAASLLFVQQTDGGTIERVRPGLFRLRLDRVSPSVSTFTDRPRRRAGVEGLNRFVGDWGRNGFVGDPPNAALVVHGAPSSRDVAMVTLSHPRYDRRDETLTYDAKPLRGTGVRSLSALAKRGDPVVPHRFGGASLFIDDSGGASYVPVTLRFYDAEAGAVIAVGASSQSVPLTWSLRPASGQFNFSSIGSPVPLNGLQINGGNLEIALGSEFGGATANFSIKLFLEAGEPLEDFYLSSPRNPSIQVTAQVGNEPEQQVGEARTLFFWQSV